MQQCEIHRFAS